MGGVFWWMVIGDEKEKPRVELDRLRGCWFLFAGKKVKKKISRKEMNDVAAAYFLRVGFYLYLFTSWFLGHNYCLEIV